MRKATIICLITMLALAAMGIGYAKWSDFVTATVTVNTGEVQIGIHDYWTWDDGNNDGWSWLFDFDDDGRDPQYPPGQNPENKNVASLVSTNAEPIPGSGYSKSITEAITNGYPYYGPSTHFDIANIGTVPVKIEDILVTDDGSNVAKYLKIGRWYITKSVSGGAKDGVGKDALFKELKYLQLHAGEPMCLEIQFYLDETDDQGNLCPQSVNGRVTYEFAASQWNEVNSPPAP
ncbi:MAG: hypothetical protein AB1500_12405 [Bacillota bacterium]